MITISQIVRNFIFILVASFMLHSSGANGAWWFLTKIIPDPPKKVVKAPDKEDNPRIDNGENNYSNPDKKIDPDISISADVFISLPPGAQVLRVSDDRMISTDAEGKKTLVATTNATGKLTLTQNGSLLLRKNDLFIEESNLLNSNNFLREASKIPNNRPIQIVWEDRSLGRVQIRQSNGRNVLMAERHQGVFIEITSIHTQNMIWALQQPLRTTNVRVVSLLHETDADVIRHIDDSVGNLHRPIGNESSEAISKIIRSQNQKTVFIVGHVEGDSFVIRDASGNIQRQVRIADIEAAAKEADASAIMLGCSAGVCSKSSGFIEPVNAVDVASGLKQAIHQRSIGETLSVISSYSGETLIRPSLVGPIRISMVTEQATDVIRKRTAIQLVGVSTLSRNRSIELSNRIVPMISNWILSTYIFGLFLFFYHYEDLRKWKNKREPAPRFGYRPVVNIMTHGLRLFCLVIVLPFALVLKVAVIFLPWVLLGYGVFHPSVLLGYSPVSGGLAAFIVSGFFGWRIWKMHSYATSGEHLVQQLWVIVLFCSVVMWTTILSVEICFDKECLNKLPILLGSTSLQLIDNYTPIASMIISILIFFILLILFGWKIWKNYKQPISKQHTAQRLWITVLFCSIVLWAAILSMGMGTDILPILIDNMVSMIISGFISFFLLIAVFARLCKLKRNLNNLPSLISAAPFLAIEFCVSHLIKRKNLESI